MVSEIESPKVILVSRSVSREGKIIAEIVKIVYQLSTKFIHERIGEEFIVIKLLNGQVRFFL